MDILPYSTCSGAARQLLLLYLGPCRIMSPRRSLLLLWALLLSPVVSLSPQSQQQSSRRAFVRDSFVFGGALSLAPANSWAVPSTGTKAPAFELPNSRGEGKTSLANLIKSGKWTVLYFYPGAFTSGCTLEARAFQRDIEEYRKLGAQIVGVSVDPVEKNAQFCTSEGLDFYMLSDQGGLVSKLYGSALSVPGFGTFSNRQTYIIDPKGNLRWIFTDVESHIARHSAEVIDKLTELESA